ncbi:MAG: hypothetical protein JWN29_1243 [Acidimicrobiales bacterium]|nr:hypothetical protein [Acidimicrobiales bacterium]
MRPDQRRPEVGPPLAGSYGFRVALVLLALSPMLVVSIASQVLEPELVRGLGASSTGLSVADGLASAGYAFGAVLAVAFVKRLPPRPLLLAYEAIFVVGSILAAAAPGIGVFVTGRTLEGLATGLLLVAALPPLVTGFGAAKLPTTVAIVDLGLFGTAFLGPLAGAAAATSPDGWRFLFAAAAVLGALGAGCAALSVPTGAPLDPEGRIDRSAIVLAAGATFLPFVGTAFLTSTQFLTWIVVAPLVVGLVFLVLLIVTQYRHREPLTPVRLISHTVPLTGLLAAMFAGAVAVTLLELATVFVTDVQHAEPAQIARDFWPAPVGVAIAAALFGMLFRSRLVPVLINVGMVVLGVAAVGVGLLRVDSVSWLVPLIAAGVGFGAGATVSPGLFQAALAVPSKQLGPAFALVELLRSEAAFLIGPIVLHVAMSSGASPSELTDGIHLGAWIMLAATVAGVALIIALPLIGGTGLQAPDLPSWLEGRERGIESPPLAAALRGAHRGR